MIADLHIHSKYSRATSPNCVPEHLSFWAQRKGIQVLGTGDFTHPAWRKELFEKLEQTEDGLYTLRKEFELPQPVPANTEQPRFLITGEISSIYKKNGKVRKVHSLILLPSLEAAEALSVKLEAIGNIHSDGRPILGLDCHDLLEITLDTCPNAVFIPAHIWTPHFSLFGAFSGFDTIEECFEDLTPYIRALETGLSSDPPMNWRISALDAYNLVSNSDAHSPSKLGREANILDTELSYPAICAAISEGKEKGLTGTIEFFPEEGKYHYDGHRNCNLCLKPSETIALGGKCPVCGKKITIGVQHRVEALADRPENYLPQAASYFESLAPLPEVIAGSTGRSAGSVKVNEQYEAMLSCIGSEFYILREAPLEEIEQKAGLCIAEGIRRLRQGKVERTPGYDGAYGTIQLLSESEIDALSGQICLFGAWPKKEKSVSRVKAVNVRPKQQHEKQEKTKKLKETLNPQQKEAVSYSGGAVAVVAGPGTGKTKTLISHIINLIEKRGISPEEITAVTFTNKAAAELKNRLAFHFQGKQLTEVHVGTFHSICLNFLKENGVTVSLALEHELQELASGIVKKFELKLSPSKLIQEVSRRKNKMLPEQKELPDEVFEAYCTQLKALGMMDFDDLLIQALVHWEKTQNSLPYLLVDEFQDINQIQYELIHAWSKNGKELFVIGDPDQSIYGFRGSQAHCFEQLKKDIPNLSVIRLEENYRSTPEILQCALPVISENGGPERILRPNRTNGAPVRLYTAQSELSEAIFIAKEINRMVGGIDMLDAHTAAQKSNDKKVYSLSDIAILYRTHRQAALVEKCLRQESIPYTVAGREDFLSDIHVRTAIGFFQFLSDPQQLPALKTYLKGQWDCPIDIMEKISHFFEQAMPLNQETLLLEAGHMQDGYLKLCIEHICRYMPLIREKKPYQLVDIWTEEQGLQKSKPMERFRNMAVFYENMSAFLENLILGQEGDLKRNAGSVYLPDTVSLMTLHGAKGLEFPIVFLCGVNNGCIPLEAEHYPTDISEERRLFYVGITRAQDELVMVTSNQPSPFLSCIPDQFFVRGNTLEKQNFSGKQLSLFEDFKI